ncbi:MAG TPA: hypothetical protein PLB89_08565 [Flavobacteriales bacterium]|nr:hypothetical protein [Flavobacteriales bacterium]
MRFARIKTVDPVDLGGCLPREDPLSPLLTYIVPAGDPQRSMLVIA